MDNHKEPRVTEQAANKIEEIRALLEEAYGFASTSPRGQQNINAALDLLDELAALTRQAAPIEVPGLGRITNEDDGYLTLQFKDEDSAQAFMHQHLPSVDVDEMPPIREDRQAAPEAPTGDPWQLGFEAGKRVGAHIAAPATQQAGAAVEHSLQDAIQHGTGIMRTRTDGSVERIDPLSIYAEPAPVRNINSENAQQFMEESLWAFIECAGNYPSIKPDARIWPHVLAYMPPAATTTSAADSRMAALEAANAQVAAAARRREERAERLGIPAVTAASASDEEAAFGNYFSGTVSCDGSESQEMVEACRIAAHDAWMERSRRAPAPSQEAAQAAHAGADTERIDHIESWLRRSKERGFAWNSYDFGTDKPVREQIDAAIAASQPQKGTQA